MLPRIGLILTGLLTAGVSAAGLLTLAAMFPAWSGLLVDTGTVGFARTLPTFLRLLGGWAALIPALAAIGAAELLAIRWMLFYAMAGAVVTGMLYAASVGWSPIAFTVDGFARRELEVMLGAGIVAGFIYWAVAGRRAGGWRREPGYAGLLRSRSQ